MMKPKNETQRPQKTVTDEQYEMVQRVLQNASRGNKSMVVPVKNGEFRVAEIRFPE